MFLISMISSAVYGIMHGNVAKYLAPIDGLNRFCGHDEGVKDFPKMFFTSLLGTPAQIIKSGVCVKECPTKKNG